MRPSEGKLQLWPIAVAAIIMVIALLSFDMPFRLNNDAPQQYRAMAVLAGEANPELADQYWALAVRVIQWKYPFGTALPLDPPPEFAVQAHSPGSKRIAIPARQQYWSALRHLWSRPDVWHRKLQFDLSWAGRAVQTVTDFIFKLIGN